MPTYDYRCDLNDRVVEVHHSMNHKIQTWGELCELAGIEPGDIDRIAPVTRQANGGNVVKSSSLKNNVPAGCNPEACCGGGGCTLDG
ncbi:MAG: zinc ribbon domain-containing protein [Gammaproteobacteria bacterium]|nr:zinc ribbon domain-containing protein [Gammaproteobacteria bacterium]